MIQLIGREGVTVTDGILDGDQEKKKQERSNGSGVSLKLFWQ